MRLRGTLVLGTAVAAALASACTKECERARECSLIGIGVGDAGARGDGGDAQASDSEVSDADAGARVDATATDSGLTRTLTRVIETGPWHIVQTAAGIAVAEPEIVFLQDAENVFRIDGEEISTYLTKADLQADIDPFISGIIDLDTGPDDALYLITYDDIIEVTAPHEASVLRPLDFQAFPRKMGVVDRDTIAVVGDGFWVSTSSAVTKVYETDPFNSSSGCGTQDLAMSRSGKFLYELGCNGSGIYFGHVDGSGTELVYGTTVGSDVDPPFPASNYLCSARDPNGGYAVVYLEYPDYPHLIHLEEDGSWFEIVTSPTFTEASSQNTEVFAFRFCSLAVAETGTIYFQTRSQLWRIDKP